MSQFDKSQPRSNGDQEYAYDIVEEDELAAGDGQGTPMSAEERAAKEQQWKTELEKVQDEIQTLRQVLASKLRRESELKRLLGTSVVSEIKQDFQSQIKTLKETTAYQKTNETLHKLGTSIAASSAYQKTSAGIKSAGEKITPAFQSFGATLSKKLDGVKNSSAFKSFGERLGSMKTRIATSRSEMSFEEALANARKDAPPGADGMPAAAAAPSADKKPA